MRVLVTGAGGLLGAAIVREFSAGAEVIAFTHATLDIGDDASVVEAVAGARPDVIVNCAAFNDVDGAEEDAVTALRVNALAVSSLSRAAVDAGATLVHYSTDFVFDGETDRPYTEAAPPNPRSVYATSKLLGEWFALEYPRAYVLRVESLFGPPVPGGRRGSLRTIADRIEQGMEVTVFMDRTVSPSYTPDVARATRELIERAAPPGLYHCVNSGYGTWEDVAVEVARLLGRQARIKGITLREAVLKAPRPRYCALSNEKLLRAGVAMPAWQEALATYLTGSA